MASLRLNRWNQNLGAEFLVVNQEVVMSFVFVHLGPVSLPLQQVPLQVSQQVAVICLIL